MIMGETKTGRSLFKGLLKGKIFWVFSSPFLTIVIAFSNTQNVQRVTLLLFRFIA